MGARCEDHFHFLSRMADSTFHDSLMEKRTNEENEGNLDAASQFNSDYGIPADKMNSKSYFGADQIKQRMVSWFTLFKREGKVPFTEEHLNNEGNGATHVNTDSETKLAFYESERFFAGTF
ncbi:hypothetical protein PMAYCL1PPCAC_22188 [Pristionchus mayeri]|uniref:Uncharacterized protein n=1 Tax=Pristionchus mayeri TaxID=1317129 RepID=A0AAN5CW41_9BILA|nr:hypothetical protein PMAYCL1PPCAC_22188 [Pristionchus mayeri]